MNQEEKNYGNYAFISYKREDEHLAKWLQRKLERYRLPAVIRTETPSAPKYIRPVFRDNTDLTGGVLADNLRRELDDSRFLIVICSPAATRSEWVNKEVQTFIDEGKADHIIPFVVDGTPRAANPAEECFPEALRNLSAEDELLGINVAEVGREKAFIRLVATMLGVKFDSLWQRHKRRIRRLRITAGAVAAVALLAGIFVYDYNRSSYAYFMDYTDSFGSPEGIVEISRDQARHRRGSFEFRYERTPFGQPGAYSWRVAQVTYVNGALRPIDIDADEWTNRSAILRLDYNKDTGKVARHNYCDTKGKVRLRHVLSQRNGVDAAIADLIHSREQLGVGYASAMSSDNGSSRENTSIVRYVYTRDADGHITACSFHANNDSRVEQSRTANPDGIFGYTYTLDSLGRWTSIAYRGLNGETVIDKKGVAERRYKYDTFGNLVEVSNYDLTGSLTLNDELWATIRNETDADGRVTAVRFYDAQNRPTLKKTEAVAAQLRVLDDRGNTIEATYTDIDGKPCNLRSGYCRHTIKYDSHGNRIEAAVFNADGTPGYTEEGAHRYEYSYDKNDNQTEILCFGPDGNLTTISSGFAGVRRSYDDRSNLIEQVSIGIDGKFTTDQDGVAIIQYKYDERDFCIEQSHFGIDEQPANDKNGISRVVMTYDDRGNCLSANLYDADGIPTSNVDGVCSIIMEYDENGNRTSWSGFDAEGKPTYDKTGIHTFRYSYDSRGNKTMATYFDVARHPSLRKDGTAGYKCEYDKAGNCITIVNIDSLGAPVCDNDGIAVYRYKFDSRRNCIERLHFDESGQPTFDGDGIHRSISVYDTRGNQVETAFYDVEGNCVPPKETGFLHAFAEYDSRDRCVRITNRDADGNLTPDVKGSAITENTYDDRGNLVRVRYYGPDGKPVLAAEGYASCVTEYNDRNLAVKTYAYGTDDKPCPVYGDIYSIESDFDEYGNIVALRYLGGNDKPINPQAYGCHRYETKLDKHGNIIEYKAYDTDGNPCMNTSGFSSYKAKYDEYDNRLEIRFFDTTGNPVLSSNDGIAMERTVYDDKGNITEISNYGIDGKLVISTQGWAVQKVTHDRYGNVAELSYFGAENEPIEPFGYHREVRFCDRYGNPVSACYYDKEDKPLGEFIEVPIIISVTSPAFYDSIPLNSIILLVDDWAIGQSRQKLQLLSKRRRSKSRSIIIMTPDGDIRTFSVEHGKIGISWQYTLLEKSQVDALRSQLHPQ